MTKQMEMNYGELCGFFKEEKKRSGKVRQLQFNRWRKKYNTIPKCLRERSF